MIALGIDPGLTGAMALICQRRGFLDVADLPTCPNGLETGGMKRWLDATQLWAQMAEWATRFDLGQEAVTAFIERPIPMPKQQVWTSASNFDCLGVLRAVAKLRGYGPELVTPNAWKRHYGLGRGKDESLEVARRLFPAAPIGLKKHHNRAEAILIARYGMMRIAG
jgi:hypothetical protein